MKRLIISFSFMLVFPLFSISQDIIFQDCFHGGVSCSGVDLSGELGVKTGVIPINTSGYSIKQVLLIFNYRYKPDSNLFVFNNEEFSINLDNVITEPIIFQANLPWDSIPVRSGIVDITENISFNNDSISYISPLLSNIISEPTFENIYFIILYEDSTLPLTNFVMIQNNQNGSPFMNYYISTLNIIDTVYDVGLTINSSYTLYENIDAAQIIIENDSIGLIQAGLNGDPLGNWGSAFGNSYYQNNTFYGQSDDVPNYTVNGTDAIANILPYLSSNNDLNIEYNYYSEDLLNDQAPYSNILWQLFLTYTTTCEEFEVTVPENVQICEGDSTILQITGGNEYEWQPQEGLSCYDCPNPTYNDTISRWYTIKVNNNDSCSKTLPIHVKVNSIPAIPVLSSEPTLCSDSSGVIVVEMMDSSNQYSFNYQAFQSNTIFENLPAGLHNIIVRTEHGCTSSSNILVEEINPAEALFSATPTQGEIPLTVQFNNQSTGATNYMWFVAGDTLEDESPSYVFNEPGEFSASLIAYDTYPWCSDTSEVLTIYTESSFNIIAPSFYNLNSGNYQIFTSEVLKLDYTLYNIAGQEVYHQGLFPTSGYCDLWQRKEVSSGVYLFKIIATSEDGQEKEITGKVMVI